MAKPSAQDIQNEMTRVGGTGGDYFAARDRLQQRLDEAERAVAKLRPVVSETDAPWSVEPAENEVLHEAKQSGLPIETARVKLRAKLAADARRLLSYSTNAATEISAAREEAEAARERAENILHAHEAAFAGVTGGILQVGNLRKKIAVIKALALDKSGEAALAKTALDYFLLKAEQPTAENQSGFRVFAEDLALRRALTPFIAEHIAPLEIQVASLVLRIKAEAKAAKMDLEKVFAILKAERAQRGESLPCEHYEGLI